MGTTWNPGSKHSAALCLSVPAHLAHRTADPTGREPHVFFGCTSHCGTTATGQRDLWTHALVTLPTHISFSLPLLHGRGGCQGEAHMQLRRTDETGQTQQQTISRRTHSQAELACAHPVSAILGAPVACHHDALRAHIRRLLQDHAAHAVCSRGVATGSQGGVINGRSAGITQCQVLKRC